MSPDYFQCFEPPNMLSNDEIICSNVLEDGKSIMDWYAISVNDSQNFSQVLEAMKIASVRESSTMSEGCRFKGKINIKEDTLLKVYVSKDDGQKSPKIEVNMGLPVASTCRKCGSYISFSLNQSKKGVNRVNAFDVMMSAARSVPLVYPLKFGNEEKGVDRGDWRLRNDLIDVLKANGFGFTEEQLDLGKSIVDNVVSSIYYILPHLKLLKERCLLLPDLFQFCIDGSELLTQTYNNPESYKNKAKLNYEEMEKRCQGPIHSAYLFSYETTKNDKTCGCHFGSCENA